MRSDTHPPAHCRGPSLDNYGTNAVMARESLNLVWEGQQRGGSQASVFPASVAAALVDPAQAAPAWQRQVVRKRPRPGDLDAAAVDYFPPSVRQKVASDQLRGP